MHYLMQMKISIFLKYRQDTFLTLNKILGKIFLKNQAKLNNSIKYWHLLSRNFWCLLPKSIFCSESKKLGSAHINFCVFTNISKFPKILSLKSFGNSSGNPYTMFVKLDIKSHFTCGKWTLYWSTVNCQNGQKIVWTNPSCLLRIRKWFKFLNMGFCWLKLQKFIQMKAF